MNENTQNKENAMLVVDQHRVESPEDKEALGEDALLGECPRCGEFINNLWNEKYCGDCGQKLKWEQERKIPLGLKVGDKFNLAGTNWTILDIKEEGYFCLADSIGEMEFDTESNNWISSQLREYLNTEYKEKISDEIGEENIVQFNRDLTSLDGQTEYGTCKDLVSLLTVDEYREYRKFIPNTCDWWWLASPWSTPCNNDETWEAVVSPFGNFDCNNYGNGGGVRPVCIFSSAIFESEE